MLRHISGILTPPLFLLMMEMGHGEELLLADANYPWRSANCHTVIHLPVDDLSLLLREVLHYFPLDSACQAPAVIMKSALESGLDSRYQEMIDACNQGCALTAVDRMAFYEQAQNATGIIVTADTTKGGNILLKKGVVRNTTKDGHNHAQY